MAAAVGLALVVRLVGLAAIAVQAHRHHRGLLTVLTKADGQWYLLIARHGYGPQPPIGPHGTYTRLTDLAFFPLYPWSIRAVHAVGGSWPLAGVVAAWIASTVAAGLLAAWARTQVGHRAALLVVALWSLSPSGAVLSMAYSEGLFTAAAAGGLLAVARRRWLLAALAASVAGLTRPTGAAVAAAVMLAVLTDARRHRWSPRHVGALLLAPAGLAVSLGHVAVVTGRLDGWFWLERTVWHSGFDGGRSSADAVGQLVAHGTAGTARPVTMAAVGVVAFLVLVLWWALDRPRPDSPAAVFTVIAAVLAVGGHRYVNTKPRFLLVVFPPLLAPARRLARAPLAVLLLAGLLALAASAWWSAYLVAVWPRAV